MSLLIDSINSHQQLSQTTIIIHAMAERFIAGVELGGTTCVAAVARLDSPTKILSRFETETTTPQETLPAVAQFLKHEQESLKIDSYDSLGIASFGPVDLRKGSKTYGYVTTTPKKIWSNSEVVGFFRREFGDFLPIGFDTDVNAPALAEAVHAVSTKTGETESTGSPTVVYITVGTGVGVGAVVAGSPVHGLLHPEGGHMIVPPRAGDKYSGSCTYKHHACVEGMVNSRAIAERVGVDKRQLQSLEDEHEVWDTVGYYLGALCLNITYLLSPEVIILGGGVMKRKVLYELTRKWFKELLRGYLDVDKYKSESGLSSYITESVFGSEAGIIGALELAQRALDK